HPSAEVAPNLVAQTTGSRSHCPTGSQNTSPIQDGLDEYLIYADRGAEFDYPGAARMLCAHIRLDPADRTFAIDRQERPTFELAAAWLISRRADPANYRFDIGEPGGPATRHEAELREHLLLAGERYHVVDHGDDTDERHDFWAILKDTAADPADQTRCLLFEQWGWETRNGAEVWTRSVQLGEFDSWDATRAWLEEWEQKRVGPLTAATDRSAPAPESLVPLTGTLKHQPVARPDQVHAARIRSLPPNTRRGEAPSAPCVVRSQAAGRSR
ncbi:hypothetical protein ACWC5I_20095, partial [Kitasatospora sp. NPDC001574]